jgi:hypothetical protein
MFDQSRIPAAGSKWRTLMSSEARARADATGGRLALETAALEAGLPVPVRARRGRAKPKAPVPPSIDETAVLWAFLAGHGWEIAPLLARAADEDQQLRLARGFRDLRSGATGAFERWVIVLRELDR